MNLMTPAEKERERERERERGKRVIESADSEKFSYTVEPPNKGHYGGNNLSLVYREVVPISEVK